MDKIIRMVHVKKNYSQKTALADVTYSVDRNEIFGLLGPSGAGKTTIIKILTGQLAATNGEVFLFGKNAVHITEEVYSQIGMVLDNSGLYDRLSCYDNLRIFADIYGVDRGYIGQSLENVELSESANKAVNQLSKGMAQRLVLARATLHKPKLLFLDEPTSGLDPATSHKIHSLIFGLRDNGTTIFLTTHNMEEATKLCDHVALLNEGKIVEYGNPMAVCRKHNTKKEIRLTLKNGKDVYLENSSTSAGRIAKYFENNDVESIHSSEPNLETVFIALTGRRLV